MLTIVLLTTHYEARGNKLMQVVEHLNINVAYPAVADPYYGTDMIKKAFWKHRPQSSGNPWFHYMLTIVPHRFW